MVEKEKTKKEMEREAAAKKSEEKAKKLKDEAEAREKKEAEEKAEIERKEKAEKALWRPICRFRAEDYDEVLQAHTGAQSLVEMRQNKKTGEVITVRIGD